MAFWTASKTQSVFNFVPNPGFEDFYVKPYLLSATHNDFISKTKFWTTPNLATSDLIASYTDTKQWFPNGNVHSGQLMAGIFVNSKDYGEYLKIELKEDLLPGQDYYAEFWVAVPNSFMGVSQAEIHLNDNFGLLTDNNFFYDNTRLINKKPQVKAFDNEVFKSGNWYKISTTFQVEKMCSNVYIGQFATDKKIQSAYFFIDDVFIGMAGDMKYIKPLEEITVNKPMTFDNVLFENGKAILLPQAYPILQAIGEEMKKNPNWSLEINGHTDNEGSTASNIRLSVQRAEAVKSYLIENEVAASKIKVNGFGETKPIADNTTEEGRQKNRRVEFVIKN